MTIETFSIFLTILSVYTLGLISPGPDFALVLRNSVSQKVGKAWPTALGIAIGVAIHLTLVSVVLGLGGEISEVFVLVVTIAGGLYLGFLGWQTLRAELHPRPEVIPVGEDTLFFGDRNWDFFRQGLWTNLFNPKAAAFFWSLLAGSTFSEMGVWSFLLKFLMVVLTLLWFWWLGLALRQARVQQGLQKIRRPISIAMGLLLIFYSIMLWTRLLT